MVEYEEENDRSVMKDIHFQVPEKMAKEFCDVFPGRGERTQILTMFVKEAIKLQSMKDYFVTVVTKEVTMKKMMEGD